MQRVTVVIGMLCLSVTSQATGPSPVAPAAPVLLPAYAHNDYENQRPLSDALDLGYRGVEVDYYVVDGELRVGHDIDRLRPGRTLEALYLVPLRERVARLGSVCADGSVFTLDIESKEPGAHAYQALHDLLSGYADILTIVRDGEETPGAVQVVLVGWHPSLDELSRQRVRFVSVHAHFDDLPENHAVYPSHLLRMISVEYRAQFTWRGGRRVPRRFDRRLLAVLAARDAVPGRIVRVFRVPGSIHVYRALVRGGVDLIGTKTLAKSHEMLREIHAETAR